VAAESVVRLADVASEDDDDVVDDDDGTETGARSEDSGRCTASTSRTDVRKRNSPAALLTADVARSELEQAAANKPQLLRSAPTRSSRRFRWMLLLRCATMNCPSSRRSSQSLFLGVPVLLAPT